MKYCEKCHTGMSDHAQFCPQCGAPAQDKKESGIQKCPYCNEPIKDGLLFCPSCGKRLAPTPGNTELKDQVQQQQQEQHQEQQDPKMHVYVHESDKEIYTDGPFGKVVNKVAYCLLALFLGGIGAHKFYAGKTKMGIIYLLFCWTFVPGVLGLIECLAALPKPSDDRGNILIW